MKKAAVLPRLLVLPVSYRRSSLLSHSFGVAAARRQYSWGALRPSKPPDYWNDVANQREFLLQLAQELGLKQVQKAILIE